MNFILHTLEKEIIVLQFGNTVHFKCLYMCLFEHFSQCCWCKYMLKWSSA